MLALHVPDGLMSAPVAVGMAAVSVLVVAVSIRRSERQLGDRHIPLAGIAAAFVFAAQMINFPVAAGTSGHLVGGALAVALLGPWLAPVTLTVVVATQAVLFSDGGLTALGINVFNLAIVTTFVGWLVLVCARRLGARSTSATVAAAGLAGLITVVCSAVALCAEWLIGATAPIPIDKMFVSMVGVHTLIGIAEAAITVLVLRAVLSARPDIVFATGTAGERDQSARRALPGWFFVLGATVIVAVLALGVAPFASRAPDGLERTIESTGGNHGAVPRPGGVFSTYAIDGVAHPGLSEALAAITGLVVVTAVLVGMLVAIGARPKTTRSAVADPTITDGVFADQV